MFLRVQGVFVHCAHDLCTVCAYEFVNLCSLLTCIPSAYNIKMFVCVCVCVLHVNMHMSVCTFVHVLVSVCVRANLCLYGLTSPMPCLDLESRTNGLH